MDSAKVGMPSLAEILKGEAPIVDTTSSTNLPATAKIVGEKASVVYASSTADAPVITKDSRGKARAVDTASTTDVPAITMNMKGTPGTDPFSTTKVSGANIAATTDTRKASRAKAHKNAKIWPKSPIVTKGPCNDHPTVFEESSTNSPADVITKSSTAANPLSISKPDSRPAIRYTDSRGLLASYYTPLSYKASSTETLTPSGPLKSSRSASSKAPSTSASTPATSLDSNEPVSSKALSTKAPTPAKTQTKEHPLSDLFEVYKKIDTFDSPLGNFHAAEVRSTNARISSTPRPKKLHVSKPKWDSEFILKKTSAEIPETPRMKPLRDVPIPLLDLGDEPWEYIFEEDVNDWEIVKKEGAYCWGLDQVRMGS
ncbi:hypothetical protein BS50DRAFT_569187 [Corynespora cassiicola Philippines]|uniref:Uncharacterized protein n=1 Tax=Corynespora cassiicola Philippines TaxID=1448308 RepID=A0A2T2P7R0_CORCC|nr:hypothetical protein BS50DRAFT_569187 [Corynespora cassiicola Philippines]